MGVRSLERGTAAIENLIKDCPQCEGKIELLEVDTASEESIRAAADVIKQKLG